MATDSRTAGTHPVAVRTADQVTARERWKHLTDLLGGTQRMRGSDYSREWLPKWDGEEISTWNNRLKQSFLYPAFRDTVDKLSGRPFAKRPVQLINGDSLDQRLLDIERNADKAGKNLTTFLRTWFRTGIVRGLAFNLIDFPRPEGEVNRSDELYNGVRPTWINLDPDDVVGISTDVARATGQALMKMLRYEFFRDEPSDEFGVAKVRRIRVWTAPEYDAYGKPALDGGDRVSRGTVQVWREEQNGWVPETDPIEHTYPGIPLVPFYTQQTGFMTAEPPLEDLGWLNIEHWQSASDQRYILRHARVPNRFEFGVDGTREDIETSKRKIGPAEVLRSINHEASAGFIEIRGDAITAGERDLATLEERMQQLGSAPLVERVSTATEAKINKGESQTVMQSWIRLLESAAREAYLVSARWLEPGKPDEELLPEDFEVDVFSDFATQDGDPAQADLLLRAWVAGAIPDEVFVQEWRARGILSDNVDVDEVVALMKERVVDSIPMVDTSDDSSGNNQDGLADGTQQA